MPMTRMDHSTDNKREKASNKSPVMKYAFLQLSRTERGLGYVSCTISLVFFSSKAIVKVRPLLLSFSNIYFFYFINISTYIATFTY